jgi:4-hydroxyproline epimerase
VIGSEFEGTVEPAGGPGVVVPGITGTAFVTAEATLLVDPADPFRDGIRG